MKIAISFDVEIPSDMLAGAFGSLMTALIEGLRFAGLCVDNFHARVPTPSVRRNRLIDVTTGTKE